MSTKQEHTVEGLRFFLSYVVGSERKVVLNCLDLRRRAVINICALSPFFSLLPLLSPSLRFPHSSPSRRRCRLQRRLSLTLFNYSPLSAQSGCAGFCGLCAVGVCVGPVLRLSHLAFGPLCGGWAGGVLCGEWWWNVVSHTTSRTRKFEDTHALVNRLRRSHFFLLVLFLFFFNRSCCLAMSLSQPLQCR